MGEALKGLVFLCMRGFVVDGNCVFVCYGDEVVLKRFSRLI